MKSNIKAYFKNLAIAADQTINAVFGGYPDETLSSRLYRKDNNAQSGKASKCWTYARITVDRLFFWQKAIVTRPICVKRTKPIFRKICNDDPHRLFCPSKHDHAIDLYRPRR